MPVEGDLTRNRNLDSDEGRQGPEEVEDAGESENTSKHRKQLKFVSPQRDQFLSALREQHRHLNVQDSAMLRKYSPCSLLI
jgi:hypothetical protein